MKKEGDKRGSEESETREARDKEVGRQGNEERESQRRYQGGKSDKGGNNRRGRQVEQTRKGRWEEE